MELFVFLVQLPKKIWIHFMNHITSQHKDSQKEQFFFSTWNQNIRLEREKTIDRRKKKITVQGQPERRILFQHIKPKHKAGKRKNYCQKERKNHSTRTARKNNYFQYIKPKHKAGKRKKNYYQKKKCIYIIQTKKTLTN